MDERCDTSFVSLTGTDSFFQLECDHSDTGAFARECLRRSGVVPSEITFLKCCKSNTHMW